MRDFQIPLRKIVNIGQNIANTWKKRSESKNTINFGPNNALNLFFKVSTLLSNVGVNYHLNNVCLFGESSSYKG